MTWAAAEKVALLAEHPNAPGVPHVVGVIRRRSCGCWASLGMRLDVNEPTLGITPCADHKVECSQALRSFSAAPPSDDPALEMLCTFVDAAIGDHPDDTVAV